MKYIIEFEDEYSMNEGGMKYHQCKQVPYWSVSHGIIKNLTPYTEPDRKAIEDEVWGFADDIHGMIIQDKVSCFGSAATSAITSNLSYQEAKSKFETWLKQKDEIHVGDEIVGIYSDGEKTPPLVVLKVEGNYYYGIYSKTGEYTQGGLNYEKTGRHFDEVAELLEKMGGDSE